MAVRHITGSKDLITILSRMGHCSSYDEVEGIDTALAEEILAKSDNGVVIPTNISPGTFVHLAADNIDINEETLDGKNTTHATSMVVFQRGTYGPAPKPAFVAEHTKRKRSLKTLNMAQCMLEFGMVGRRPITDLQGKVSKE